VFFKDIPGTGSVKQLMQRAAQDQKVPHASILLGPPGRAGLPIVRALIALMLCKNPQAGDSCGDCSNCQKTHHLSHPDIHWTVPTIGSKSSSADVIQSWREMMLKQPYSSLSDWQEQIEAENKQFNINVREIQDIIEFAGMKSYQGEEKFLVVWMADHLGQDGNRLLKMIEEPPNGMYIFLLAHGRESILNTILSRCRLLVLDPLSDEDIREFLQGKNELDPQTAQSVAFQANGNLNTALRSIEQAQDAGFQDFVDWMRACYTGRPPEIIQRADTFAKLGREAQKHLIQVGLNTLRAILTHQYLGADQLRLPIDHQKPVKNLAKLLNIQQIDQVVQLLQTAGQGLQQNANAKILFTHISHQIHRAFHSD
jgi:DNA polymerase-3 subunit delta'